MKEPDVLLTKEEEADIMFPDALPARDLVRTLPPALHARSEAAGGLGRRATTRHDALRRAATRRDAPRRTVSQRTATTPPFSPPARRPPREHITGPPTHKPAHPLIRSSNPAAAAAAATARILQMEHRLEDKASARNDRLREAKRQACDVEGQRRREEEFQRSVAMLQLRAESEGLAASLRQRQEEKHIRKSDGDADGAGAEEEEGKDPNAAFFITEMDEQGSGGGSKALRVSKRALERAAGGAGGSGGSGGSGGRAEQSTKPNVRGGLVYYDE